MISAHWEPLAFELPDAMATVGAGWRRFIDTALPAGADIQEWTTAPVVSGPTYPVQSCSMVVLVARSPVSA